MINDLTLTKEKINLCERRSVDDRGQKLEYSLYSVITDNKKEYFALEICDKDSFELAVIGDEINSAKELYLRIVEGRVSPVSIDDIIHDMKMSKKY